MVCDVVELDAISREELNQALRDLEQQLAAGTAQVVISESGAIAFQGWEGRGPWMDSCAFNRLMAEGSVELQLAVQRAEVMTGRRIDPFEIASGMHSHDGGATWGRH